MKMEKIRIGVILSGLSSECEVSLYSERNVFDMMDRERYVPVPVFLDRDTPFRILPWQRVARNTTVDDRHKDH